MQTYTRVLSEDKVVANRDPGIRSNPFTCPCPLQGIKSQLSTIVVGSNSNNNIIIIIIIIICTNNYKKQILKYSTTTKDICGK
jgi:hypothetical protein